MRDRRGVFDSHEAAEIVESELLRTAAAYGFAVCAYCVMPDHLHALVQGAKAQADFRLFMRCFRGRTSRKYRQIAGLSLWQRGYHDRILRAQEPTGRVAAYIVRNPVRAGLVDDPATYRYSWTEGWPAAVSQPSAAGARSPT